MNELDLIDIDLSWRQCIEGFKKQDELMGSAYHRKKQYMSVAADRYYEQHGKMAGFVGKFADDAGISYDYASQINRKRNSGCNPKNFSSDVEKLLLSTPVELREDFEKSEEPVTPTQVKQAKEGYKRLKEDPDLDDVAQDLQAGRKTPREAAQEAWERSEEKRKRMEENPQVIDFDAAVKSKEHYSIRTSATSFVVAMEQMVSKSDDKDIKRELLLAIQTDPLNIKVPALFAMREVLEELCNEFDQPQVKKTH